MRHVLASSGSAGMVVPSKAWCGKVRRGWAWQAGFVGVRRLEVVMAWHGRQGKARSGRSRHGEAGHGRRGA